LREKERSGKERSAVYKKERKELIKQSTSRKNPYDIAERRGDGRGKEGRKRRSLLCDSWEREGYL
jgi:hypothetical protein